MPLKLTTTLALALTLAAAAPTRVEAQAASSPITPEVGVAIALVPGALLVGLSVADTVSFAAGRPFDAVFAGGDLVTGSLAIAASIAALALYEQGQDLGAMAGVSALGIALGGYQVAHGIWSLTTPAPTPEAAPPLTLVPVPTPYGLSLSASGAF